MATESKEILDIDVSNASLSIDELKAKIKALQEAVKANSAEGKDYQAELKAMKEAQYALKDAMTLTASAFKDVAAGTDLTQKSYAQLSHEMALLKEAFKTTTDAAERANLGKQINAINDALKEMDASVGVYSRSVGDYANQVGKALADMPQFAEPFHRSLDNINKSAKLLSSNPLLGTVTLLYPLLAKITEGIRENDGAIQSVNKAMVSLQPVFDFLGNILDKIAGVVSTVIDRFVALAGESGQTFKNIIAGAVGVGNSILQYLLTPIRTTIEAFKGLGTIVKDVFTGQFKDIKADAEAAFSGIKDAFIKGFSFKENFELGKQVGEQFAGGVRESKPAVVAEAHAIATEVKDEFGSMLKDLDSEIATAISESLKAEADAARQLGSEADIALGNIDKATKRQLEWNRLMIDDTQARADAQLEIEMRANEQKLALLTQYYDEAMGAGAWEVALDLSQQRADLEVEIEMQKYERMKAMRVADSEDLAQTQEKNKGIMSQYVGGVQGLIDTLADVYEDNAQDTTKAAEKTKGVRIASSTIDTFNGAVAAYASAASLPTPTNMIVGALNAAAITAAGIANIAKMKSTSVGGGSSVAPSISTAVSAPVQQVSIPQTAVLTGQTAEARLNAIADRKVYILASDLQAEGTRVQVQRTETSIG